MSVYFLNSLPLLSFYLFTILKSYLQQPSVSGTVDSREVKDCRGVTYGRGRAGAVQARAERRRATVTGFCPHQAVLTRGEVWTAVVPHARAAVLQGEDTGACG